MDYLVSVPCSIRHGSIPSSTVLRKSVRFFIIKNIFLIIKNTFQVEIWPVSRLNDSQTQERGFKEMKIQKKFEVKMCREFIDKLRPVLTWSVRTLINNSSGYKLTNWTTGGPSSLHERGRDSCLRVVLCYKRLFIKACMGCKQFFLKERKNVMFFNKIDLPNCLVVFFVVYPRCLYLLLDQLPNFKIGSSKLPWTRSPMA